MRLPKPKTIARALGIITALISPTTQAITGSFKQLPENWRLADEQHTVVVNGTKYLETLVETIEPINGHHRRAWLTTDLQGNIVFDQEVCKKADYAAEVLENISNINPETLENMRQGYLTVADTPLEFSLDATGTVLESAISLLFNPQAPSQQALKITEDLAKKYGEHLATTIATLPEEDLQDPEKILKTLEDSLKGNISQELTQASDDMLEAQKILHAAQRTGKISYDDAEDFLTHLTRARQKAESTAAYFTTFHDNFSALRFAGEKAVNVATSDISPIDQATNLLPIPVSEVKQVLRTQLLDLIYQEQIQKAEQASEAARASAETTLKQQDPQQFFESHSKETQAELYVKIALNLTKRSHSEEEFKEAAFLLGKARALFPDNEIIEHNSAVFYQRIGARNYKDGNLETAERCFRTALSFKSDPRLKSSLAEILKKRAFTSLREEQLPQAHSLLKEAHQYSQSNETETAQNYFNLTISLAESLLEQGHPEKALALLQDASSSLAQKESLPQENIIDLLQSQKLSQAGRQGLAILIGTQGQVALEQEALEESYSLLTSSISTLESLLTQNPEFSSDHLPHLYNQLAVHFSKAGTPEQALKLIPQFDNLQGDHIESAKESFKAILACGLISEGDYTQALPLLEQACKYFTDDSELLEFFAQSCHEAGVLSFKEGDYAEAIPHLEKALKLLPQDKILRQNLGASYANLATTIDGFTEEKDGLYEKALALAYGNPTLIKNALTYLNNKASDIVMDCDDLDCFSEAVEIYKRAHSLLKGVGQLIPESRYQSLEQTITTNIAYANALIADHYYTNGNYSKAREFLAIARKYDPDNEQYQINIQPPQRSGEIAGEVGSALLGIAGAALIIKGISEGNTSRSIPIPPPRTETEQWRRWKSIQTRDGNVYMDGQKANPSEVKRDGRWR